MPQAAAPAASAAAPSPAILYREQLNTMIEMGLTDSDANLQALIATGGNVQAAINRLLGS
jgi:ubiquilin